MVEKHYQHALSTYWSCLILNEVSLPPPPAAVDGEIYFHYFDARDRIGQNHLITDWMESLMRMPNSKQNSL